MMMMKDVKDEGKQISPLFPRLHVNDREKGGPRAPPRNKMALYEQLSIPLQKFSSPSPSPSASKHSPAPPMSSGAYQINSRTSASGSPVKCLSGKHEVTSLGIKLTPTQEKENPKTAISRFGTLSTHLLASQGNPTQLESMQDDKVPVLRKQLRGDDFAALERTKLPPITRCARGNEKLSERKRCLNPGSSTQGQSCVDKKAEPVGPVENQCGKNAQDSDPKEHEMHVASPIPRERPDPIRSARVASNASSSPSHGNSRCELLKRPLESETLECRSHSSGVGIKLPRIKGPPIPDDHSFQVNEIPVRGEAANLANSTLNSLPENKTNINTRGDDGKCNEVGNGDMQAAKRCQFLETVIRESASAISILPDDVVGAIGEKLFWKTRRAIVDQQRVFGVQVFELHRLIKVQKLLSRSHELLEVFGLGNLKPPAEAIRTTEVPSERTSELPWKDQTNGNPQGKPPTAKISLPPINSDIRKDLVAKRPEQMAYPFCYPAAGNHWLVPVMSPSEGLVYKPYTGPCPPSGGASFYGGHGPMSLGPTLGDPNGTFGIPTSHDQGIGVGDSYFPPPITLPVMNPMDRRFSMGEANISQFYSPSSCNVSTQVSKVVAFSQHESKSHKHSEMQGSTGSSPMDPMNGGTSMLVLFPMEQASDKAAGETRSTDQPRGVIKVVPHNRKSASESAARIFRSIQEERGRRD